MRHVKILQFFKILLDFSFMFMFMFLEQHQVECNCSMIKVGWIASGVFLKEVGAVLAHNS
jgi:hypothetical protein